MDSAEYYLSFHVLDAKPKITEIIFTNKTITGTASCVVVTGIQPRLRLGDGGTATPATNGSGLFHDGCNRSAAHIVPCIPIGLQICSPSWVELAQLIPQLFLPLWLQGLEAMKAELGHLPGQVLSLLPWPMAGLITRICRFP